MTAMVLHARLILSISLLSVAIGLAGCGANVTPQPAPLTVTLGSSTVVVPQDGTPVTLPVTISPLGCEPTDSTWKKSSLRRGCPSAR